MSAEEVTVDEAVPLFTVLLQRLLAEAGVRALVIKGPVFAALGVRRKKRSNDVDFLIHQCERAAAWTALRAADWESVTQTYPDSMDGFYYSVTFAHPMSPVTLDLHHRIQGLMKDSAGAFEVMWRGRTVVDLAHQEVTTLSGEHALVVEALNTIKSHPAVDPRLLVRPVAQAAFRLALPGERVLRSAQELGAVRTAESLLLETAALAVPAAADEADRSWGRAHDGRKAVLYLLANSPTDLLPYLWQHVVLSERTAHSWAESNGIAYRGRAQVYAARAVKVVLPRKVWVRLTTRHQRASRAGVDLSQG